MDLKVTTMDGKAAGKVAVSESVFGLEPRQDIISRMVRYQLASRRQGTHSVKNRSDISATGKKMYKQKGTGNARHSTAKAPQFRGGGRAFGPVSRDHSFSLPKKVRSLALRHALSSKVLSGDLIVVDDVKSFNPKTSILKAQLSKLGLDNVLMVCGDKLDDGLRLAARNIPNLDALPIQGINVYNIIRRSGLILSKSAVEALEERLK